jgi:hypothetical protein
MALMERDNWGEVRLKAMAALLVHCPVPVATYLSSQLYSDNHTIGAKMDIIDLFVAAAQELSSLHDTTKRAVTLVGPSATPAANRLTTVSNSSSGSSSSNGERKVTKLVEPASEDGLTYQQRLEIVRQRVEAKTRRYISLSTCFQIILCFDVVIIWVVYCNRWGQKKTPDPIQGINRFANGTLYAPNIIPYHSHALNLCNDGSSCTSILLWIGS